ncbi:MAG: FxsA family protein [Gemmatimonadales bacterium]|nr:MAG: FxsA family protein [Gemmatimonadales bacterium]
MFARLGCLFVVVPLLELALLVWIGQWIGVLPTVGIVAATGLLGAWLARKQGLRTLTELQLRAARGEIPAQAMMDGAAILVGGLLLLTPGILSDILGFSLLLPPTRRVLQRWAGERIVRGIRKGTVKVTFMGMGGGPPGPGGHGGFGSGGMTDSDDPDELPPRPGEIIQK